MTDPTQPVLVFSMPGLTKDDKAMLDTNYAEIHSAVPADLIKAFVAANLKLSPNAVVYILAGGSQWLLNDDKNYYLMRADGEKLDVYSVTSAVYSVLLTKSKTATGVASIVIITNACQAIRNTSLALPKDMTKPDWFDPLVAHLDAAKQLADEWIDTLAPDLTCALPQKVIHYDTQYNAITNSIIKIADANPQAQGSDDPNVKNVFALITALKGQVVKIHDDIGKDDEKLLEWGKRMQTAHDNLSGGVASIQAAEAALAADIGKMDTDMARLRSEIDGLNKAICAAACAVAIGIFVAIVGVVLAFETFGAGLVVAGIGAAAVIGGAVTWGIMQSKVNNDYDQISKDQHEKDVDKQQIIALRGLEVATSQTVDAIATATSALSNVRALWKLFEGELDGVLGQLNQAQTGLALIVNEAFVNGAQAEWALAGELAKQLLAPVPQGTPVVANLPMDVKVPKAA